MSTTTIDVSKSVPHERWIEFFDPRCPSNGDDI
jgi:hypothetical protein